MALAAIKSGALVPLKELKPSSESFKDGASLRVTGKYNLPPYMENLLTLSVTFRGK